MKEQLQAIKDKTLQSIEAVADLKALDDIRVNILGKKGELTSILKGMKDVAPEDRPVIGALVNEVRQTIEAELENAKATIAKKVREKQLKEEVIDVTMPSKKRRCLVIDIQCILS